MVSPMKFALPKVFELVYTCCLEGGGAVEFNQDVVDEYLGADPDTAWTVGKNALGHLGQRLDDYDNAVRHGTWQRGLAKLFERELAVLRHHGDGVYELTDPETAAEILGPRKPLPPSLVLRKVGAMHCLDRRR